jgi:hypothetical protein
LICPLGLPSEAMRGLLAFQLVEKRALSPPELAGASYAVMYTMKNAVAAAAITSRTTSGSRNGVMRP